MVLFSDSIRLIVHACFYSSKAHRDNDTHARSMIEINDARHLFSAPL
jgi:hypothetical protein